MLAKITQFLNRKTIFNPTLVSLKVIPSPICTSHRSFWGVECHCAGGFTTPTVLITIRCALVVQEPRGRQQHKCPPGLVQSLLYHPRAQYCDVTNANLIMNPIIIRQLLGWISALQHEIRFTHKCGKFKIIM